MTGTARQYSYQMVHYLRLTMDYTDDETAKVVGTVPAGSVVLKGASGVNVTTVFNSGGTEVISLGVTGATQKFASAMVLGTADFLPCDVTGSYHVGAADIDVIATITMTGTAATTGSAEVIIAYVPDNDG
jgi:hypothetical protein